MKLLGLKPVLFLQILTFNIDPHQIKTVWIGSSTSSVKHLGETRIHVIRTTVMKQREGLDDLKPEHHKQGCSKFLILLK